MRPSRALIAPILLGSALSVAAGTACAPSPRGPAPRVAEPSVRAELPVCAKEARRELVLAFGGDVIAHEAVRAAGAKSGYRALLQGAERTLRDADLAFVNLESPITERTTRKGDMIFHGDEAMLTALVDVGVDVVSLANNHALDQGRPGLVDTLDAVARSGVVGVGAAGSLREACAPVVIERRGFKIGFLARTHYMNFPEETGKPDVCRLVEGPLRRAVAALRATPVDLVVASLHWGNEYERAPRQEQIDAAHRIVESGVDLLIGHHPHVLQPVERVRTRRGRDAVIAYSLGNLLSNQGHDFDPQRAKESAGDTRDVAILRVSVARGEDGGAHVASVTAVPLWTEHGGEAIRVVAATSRRERIGKALGVPLVDAPAADERCAYGRPRRATAARGPLYPSFHR